MFAVGADAGEGIFTPSQKIIRGTPVLDKPSKLKRALVGPCLLRVSSVASVVSDSAPPWTAARQAPLSVGFSWQECWSKLPCPPLGDLPDPGMEPESPVLQADSFLAEPWRKPPIFTQDVYSDEILMKVFKKCEP